MNIPNYKIIKQIYESTYSEVYRAIRLTDNLPVIIKMLKQDYSLINGFARYKQEYELLCNLNVENIIKVFGLENPQNTIALILEDFGGDSLKKLREEQSCNLREFLSIAIKIADALKNIHAANIIHKDINLSNIVYNPQTAQLKIIDFGISTRLSREHSTLKNPNILEGTLSYISPEQTGRINRGLDYRTDFYSLGVTFYELLTHQLPFTTKDDLELVHCHIAKQPLSPSQLDSSIPLAISNIIMKLLAKNAEDRYQSAWGLKVDLEHCLRQLESGNIAEFPLGAQDISDKFLIPQKLYGREIEINQLLQTFETVSAGNSQLLLVAGYSGVGKSALVQELYRPITAKRGYFISGKYDQFQRNIPHSAIIQAFRDLIKQLLTETQEQLAYWKSQILQAVGSNGQIIIDVIDEVELIIGKQPEISTLAPTESQNRFNLVFQNFIKVFCQAEHPLVIFLDDLQWIDSASLKLMNLMMNDIPYLLLMGAYRDNEVNHIHPLMINLDEMKQQGILIQTLSLSPLILEDLNQLISDTLNLPLSQTLPLAKLVLEKTDGNPFFVGEFLKTLYVEKLLNFDAEKFQWHWVLQRIKARNITDNVVELMTSKIQQLSSTTQTLLKIAASVGNQFNLETLSIIYETPTEVIKTELWGALKEGLIAPLSEQYKFVHDRIQQAAYSLISEEEKIALHWQIGQVLLKDQNNIEDHIFEIVDHLNQAHSFVTTEAEKIQLISLNLQAAQKAKAATAYQMAMEYLCHAEQFLMPEHWNSDFDLMVTFHLEMLEIMYLNGDFTRMEQLIKSVLQHEKLSIVDKIKIYEIQVQAYVSQTQLLKAIQTTREGLALSGVELPEQPTPELINQALGETALKWQGSSIAKLLDLPQMTDINRLVSMRLISTSIPAFYQGMPAMFPLLVSQMVSLSIEHGNTDQSPFAYACYGIFLCSAMAIEEGYQFGQLAVQLQEKLNIKTRRSTTLFVVDNFINPWKEPLLITAQRLKDVYQIAVNEGNLEYAGYASINYCINYFLSGQPLIEAEQIISSSIQIVKQLKQDTSVKFAKIYHLLALDLLTPVQSDNSVTHLSEESKQLVDFIKSLNDFYSLFRFYAGRAYLHYLFNEPHQALENVLLAKQYIVGASGNFVVMTFNYYDSLVLLALYEESDDLKRIEILQQVNENQEKLKLAAMYAPMNFQHKYDLVEAEKARVLNDKWQALEYYEQAISGAQENNYLPEEALAYELAARFYIKQNMEQVAQLYLQEAYYRYQRWGALAKMQDLQKKYAAFFIRKMRVESQATTYTRTVSFIPTTSTTDHGLDVNSLAKAAQILSGEIILSRLLEKVMQIVIENAGAEQGFLILPRQEHWFIEAESKVGQTDVVVLQSISIENNQQLSSAIIYYIIRTQQPLVLDNAAKVGRFTHDAHIMRSQVKSVLGMPLLNQGKLVGILYLENNLAEGVFTTTRIETLNVLSSQMAISIQNAKLYAEIRESEKTLNQFLEAIPVGIGILDSLGKPYFVNQKGQQLLGRGVIEHNSGQLTEIYDLYVEKTDQVYPPEKLPVIRALKGECASVDDLEVHQKDKIIPLEAWGTPIFDEQGKVIYAMTAFQDITERKQAEANRIQLIQEQEAKNAALHYSKTIEEKNAQLVQLNQDKNEFLGIAAHDLKNPLSGILGLAEIMTASEGLLSPEEIVEYSSMIEDSSRRMFTLIKNLLDVNAIESGKMNTNLETTDILPTVKKIIQTYTDRAKAKNIDFYLKTDENQYIAFVDKDITHQVLDNLISNAIKYSPHHKNVTVTISTVDQNIRCEIKDEGVGLSKEDQQKLFGKFTRLSTKPTGGEHSTGLGLFIVKKLITSMNGNVWCESELGKGATFIVTFPIK